IELAGQALSQSPAAIARGLRAIDRRGVSATMATGRAERAMQERTASVASSADDVVARARALAPLIAAHAARIEQQRQIVPEVLAQLYQAGLFRMLLPRSCGGLEIDPITFVQAVEE